MMTPKPKPMVQQLRDQIVDDARAGRLPRGTPMPNLRGLATRYSTTVSTIRRSLDILKKDGVIRTVHGGGIYLTDQLFEQDHRRNLMEMEGLLQPAAVKRKLVVSLKDAMPYQQAYWNRWVEGFNRQHPHVQVQLYLEDELEPGTTPDLRQMLDVELIAAARGGKLHPIQAQGVMTEALESHLAESAYVQGRQQLWGVPLLATVPVMLVNRAMLARAKVDEARCRQMTWESFVELAVELAQARDGGCWAEGSYVAASVHSPIVYLMGKDKRVWDGGEGRFRMDHPVMPAFLRELALLGAQSGAVPADEAYRREGGIGYMAIQGRISLTAFCSNVLDMLFPRGMPEQFTVVPFPISASGGSLWAANYLGISAGSLRVRECHQFLAYLTSPEAARIAVEHKMTPVCQPEPPEAGEGPCPSLRQAARHVFERSMPLLAVGEHNYQLIREHLGALVDQVRDGYLTPAQVMSHLVDQAALPRNPLHSTPSTVEKP
ncbi:MAG: extracellular solute-binding protein [Phycisphaeraceae bacterium]|nr:extracellular solute-binding protein [Phycisphaeraceae bacterium]